MIKFTNKTIREEVSCSLSGLDINGSVNYREGKITDASFNLNTGSSYGYASVTADGKINIGGFAASEMSGVSSLFSDFFDELAAHVSGAETEEA